MSNQANDEPAPSFRKTHKFIKDVMLQEKSNCYIRLEGVNTVRAFSRQFIRDLTVVAAKIAKGRQADDNAGPVIITSLDIILAARFLDVHHLLGENINYQYIKQQPHLSDDFLIVDKCE